MQIVEHGGLSCLHIGDQPEDCFGCLLALDHSPENQTGVALNRIDWVLVIVDKQTQNDKWILSFQIDRQPIVVFITFHIESALFRRSSNLYWVW